MIGALWLLAEDNILDKLFLFHSGVATTLGGLLPGVVVPVGGDGDDVVLPPLVDGDEGSGGRSTGDLLAPGSCLLSTIFILLAMLVGNPLYLGSTLSMDTSCLAIMSLLPLLVPVRMSTQHP